MERMQWHTHAHPVPLHVCTCVQCRGKGKSVGKSGNECRHGSWEYGSFKSSGAPNQRQPKSSQKLLSYISLRMAVTCKSLLTSPSCPTHLGHLSLSHSHTHTPKNTGAIMWHEASHNHVHPGLLASGRPAPAQKIPGPKSAPRSRGVPNRSHRPQAVTHYCNLGPEA